MKKPIAILSLPLRLFLRNYPLVEVIVNMDGYRTIKRDLAKEKAVKEVMQKISDMKQEVTP